MPLLGVNGVCIIAHGASSPLAIKNAIRAATESIQHEINPQILREIQSYNEKCAARTHAGPISQEDRFRLSRQAVMFPNVFSRTGNSSIS